MKNLLTRTLFGVLYVAVIVGCFVVFPPAFPVLAILVIGITLSEFYNFTLGPVAYRLERVCAMLASVIFFTMLYMHFTNGISLRCIGFAIVPLLVAAIAPIFRKDHTDFKNIALVSAGIMYIGLPIALVPCIVFRTGVYDGFFLLGVFLLIIASDCGAYLLGSSLGQKPGAKKLAPAISPKKSWWGFAGAIFCSSLAGLGMHYWSLFQSWTAIPLVHCIVLGALIGVGSVAGDLVESLWKRAFGVKDSGNILPGHGGLYDRLDSAIFAIPLISIYLMIVGLL